MRFFGDFLFWARSKNSLGFETPGIRDSRKSPVKIPEKFLISVTKKPPLLSVLQISILFNLLFL